MPVTKNLQAVGQFTVTLSPNTPREFVDAFAMGTNGFGSLVVTPVWMEPSSFSSSTLLKKSIFTGMYRKESSTSSWGARFNVLEGLHATGWLGDDSGKGTLLEATVSTSQNLASWVSSILSGVSSVTTGNVQSNASNLAWQYGWNSSNASSPRQGLEYVCGFYDINYQVNDDLSVDVGDANYLWGSLEPGILANPWYSGVDDRFRMIQSTISPEADVESYADRVLAEGGGFTDGTGGSPPYHDALGHTVSIKEKFTASAAVSSADLNAQASTELARIDAPFQMPTITTNQPGIMQHLRPGQDLHVYHPEADLADYSPVLVDTYIYAQPVWPTVLQVQSITMPLECGMGVYFQRSDGGGFMDLTRWVQWEPPGAQISVGAARLQLKTAVQQRGGTFAA